MKDELHTKQEMIPHSPHENLGRKKTSAKCVSQIHGRAHAAMTMKRFLPNFSIVIICHPPQQQTFFLIPKVKTALNLRIQDIKDTMDFKNLMQPPPRIPSVTVLFKF